MKTRNIISSVFRSYSYKVVFVRHGESVWNKENRFTGWTDVDLSQTGINEAKNAGKSLKEHNFKFDVCYTSYLKRAIKTWNAISDELDINHIPLHKHWRLNERHYGALQGLNKSETAAKYGESQVKIWRRSYDIQPPSLEAKDERFPGFDTKYSHLPRDVLPFTECLKDTVVRVLPYWHDNIASSILGGKNVIVCAHGNSLRAIIKHLDNISENEITELNIPTATPLVYELDNELKPIKHYYLESEESIKKKLEEVAKQGASKK